MIGTKLAVHLVSAKSTLVCTTHPYAELQTGTLFTENGNSRVIAICPECSASHSAQWATPEERDAELEHRAKQLYLSPDSAVGRGAA